MKKTNLLRLLEKYGQKDKIPKSILLVIDLPLILTLSVDEIVYDSDHNILYANEPYIEQNKDDIGILFLRKLLYVYLVHEQRLSKYNQVVQVGEVVDYLANIVSLIEVNQFIEEYGFPKRKKLTYSWFNNIYKTAYKTNTPAEVLADYVLENGLVVQREKKRNKPQNQKEGGRTSQQSTLEVMQLHNNALQLKNLNEMYAEEIFAIKKRNRFDKELTNLNISKRLWGGKKLDDSGLSNLEKQYLSELLMKFSKEYNSKRKNILRPLRNQLLSLFDGGFKKTYEKLEKRPYLARYRGVKKGRKKAKGCYKVIVRIDVSFSMKQHAIFKALELTKEVARQTGTEVFVQGFSSRLVNNRTKVDCLDKSTYSDEVLNSLLDRKERVSNQSFPVQFDELDASEVVIIIGDGRFCWGRNKRKGIAILLDGDRESIANARKVMNVINLKAKDI